MEKENKVGKKPTLEGAKAMTFVSDTRTNEKIERIGKKLNKSKSEVIRMAVDELDV
jgi:hypothetical protein